MPGIVVEKINQKKDDGYYYFNEPGACLEKFHTSKVLRIQHHWKGKTLLLTLQAEQTGR